MLKVYQIINGISQEVKPVNGVYNVYELGIYSFFYESDNLISQGVFIEDLPIEKDKISIIKNQIQIAKNRYFEDYFGFAGLKINDEIFHFNIKIEKLKLSEIEEIFLYLWKKEDSLFNIFFSKSSYHVDFKKKGIELGQTSKFISFVEEFVSKFEKLYFSFENSPHTVLRKHKKKVDYDPFKVSPESIDWILENIDEINFNNSFAGHFNSFRVKNNHGLIDHIRTIENKNSYETYENEIILGAFVTLLKRLNRLKLEVTSNINITSTSNEKYADFRDLKRIPFIKLFNDTISLEKKVQKLYKKYTSIFKDVKPRYEKPVLTSVFLKKNHYQKSFKLIKNLNDYKFELLGEFKLLNISKLSKLYEVYNLFILIDAIKEHLKLDLFSVENAESNRDDEIIEKISIKNEFYTINLFYELTYFSYENKLNQTFLRRIDARKGTYYRPDFTLEIIDNKINSRKYFILDSKYSKQEVVKNRYLSSLVAKYILNTGIKNDRNKKISNLCFIYPGDYSEIIIENEFYEPTVNMVGSKPKNEEPLRNLMYSFLKKNIKDNFLIKNTNQLQLFE